MSSGGERNDEAQKLDTVRHRIALVDWRSCLAHPKPPF